MVQIQYKNCLTLNNLKDTYPIKNPMYGPKNCGHEGAPFWSVWLLLVGLVLVGGDNPRFLHKLSWLNLQIREGGKKRKRRWKEREVLGKFFYQHFLQQKLVPFVIALVGEEFERVILKYISIITLWYKFCAISFNKSSGVKNNVSKF